MCKEYPLTGGWFCWFDEAAEIPKSVFETKPLPTQDNFWWYPARPTNPERLNPKLAENAP